MRPEELTQIENEVFTKIVMDELKRQKIAGTKIDDYILDKYKIDVLTIEKVKEILKGN